MKLVPGLFSILAAMVLVGCQGDPTNAPTAKAVEDANAKRMADIDNNPKLTPEQKAQLKSHLGRLGTGSAKPGQMPR